MGRQDNLICETGLLSQTGAEQLDAIPVTHRWHDPITYVLLIPIRTDGLHLELTLPNIPLQQRKAPSNVTLNALCFSTITAPKSV